MPRFLLALALSLFVSLIAAVPTHSLYKIQLLTSDGHCPIFKTENPLIGVNSTFTMTLINDPEICKSIYFIYDTLANAISIPPELSPAFGTCGIVYPQYSTVDSTGFSLTTIPGEIFEASTLDWVVDPISKEVSARVDNGAQTYRLRVFGDNVKLVEESQIAVVGGGLFDMLIMEVDPLGNSIMNNTGFIGTCVSPTLYSVQE